MARQTRRKNNNERKSSVLGWEALVDFGIQTASEISVSPERALRCVPVYAGIRVRCETLGSLPLHLYERRDGGGKERATDHSLYHLIHDRPNAWTSAADFVMQLEKDVITHGGGFAMANRSGDVIVELIRLAPGSVQVETTESLEPQYRVTLKSGKQQIYPWSDILHVPALDGLAAIKQAREAIGLCISMERYAGLLFGNGARPSGLLKTKGKLSDARFEHLKKTWNATHSGDNAGKTAILEDGTEFEALSFSSVDLQFAALREFQIIEIARALGVPPSLLFDYGRATWGNAEQMAQAFLTFTILPRMRLWQGAVARLLPADEQQKYFAEFLVDELVKADIAARFEAYSKAIASRVLNPNEARAKENLPPYPDGDEFLNPNIQSTPTSATPAARPKLTAVAA